MIFMRNWKRKIWFTFLMVWKLYSFFRYFKQLRRWDRVSSLFFGLSFVIFIEIKYFHENILLPGEVFIHHLLIFIFVRIFKEFIFQIYNKRFNTHAVFWEFWLNHRSFFKLFLKSLNNFIDHFDVEFLELFFEIFSDDFV